MSRSTVIIGGGLGGLFTGALLAKEGVAVTVLEKNAIIGGGLQSFTRWGEVFDTGIHFVGGLQEGGSVRRICEFLGIWDKVHVVNNDPAFMDGIYVAEDRHLYPIAQGKEGFVESLSRFFPAERANLTAYADALYRLTQEIDLFYLRPQKAMPLESEVFQMSAKAFIAKYISDERLRRLVAYMNPLYGGRGDRTPAYIHALISVLYMMGGSSRLAGGTLLFAEALRDVIVSHGGQVLAGDPVQAVHSAERRITGVTTASGKTYTADTYICAIHPCTFLNLLDDPAILPRSYRSRLEENPNSCSAFTVNIKFKPERFPYIPHTLYYMSSYEDIWNLSASEGWPRGFVVVTPPAIGQGPWAGKMIVTVLMEWDLVRRWEDTRTGHRGADYEAWKAECAEKVLAGLEQMFPGFRDTVEAVNTASPLTIRDFYGVKEGSMYGYTKDYEHLYFSQIPVVTKVPNLLLTGQNCNLHGFCGVALTSVMTAEALLGPGSILSRL